MCETQLDPNHVWIDTLLYESMTKLTASAAI